MRPVGTSMLTLASALLLLAGCGGDDTGAPANDTTAPSTAETTARADDTERADTGDEDETIIGERVERWPSSLDGLDPADPARWTVEVVSTAPHDPSAFTQGLEHLDDGRLLESTGIRGLSDVRIVDAATGAVEVAAELAPEEFGEGLTVVDDTVIQLTWQEQTARRWSLPDLEPLPSFKYTGEGWGLCLLDDRLAMSDGTGVLQWRDPTDFGLLATVDVTRAGAPVTAINELECVDGHVVANLWRSSDVVVISPDGDVVATIDAGPLVDTIASTEPLREVLNGIAAHPDGTFSLTGKLWPTRFVVEVVEP
ncbi:MAG: glutaminyl-peptide cyclotransferase [Actinomycetota bacterium]